MTLMADLQRAAGSGLIHTINPITLTGGTP